MRAFPRALIDQNISGTTVATEISGTIDLSQSPAVPTGLWVRKLDGSSADLQPWPTFDIAAHRDVLSR